jgi:hypothetical protein
LGHYLLLGKDSAEVANLDLFGRFQGNISQVFQFNAQRGGKDFQESASPGGTFVVHDKIDHLAAIYLHALGILPTDVDSCSDIGKQAGYPSGMAGKLCNMTVGERAFRRP